MNYEYAPEDNVIMQALAEFSYLQSRQLVTITKRSPRVIRRRLLALRVLGFVRCMALPHETDLHINPGHLIHFLTRKGADFCFEHFGIEAHASSRTENTWLKHDFEVSEIHLALKKALGSRLVFAQRFNIADHGVNPDHFFGIERNGSVEYFFLENEKGRAKTVNHKQTIIEKFEQYLAYSQGAFQKTWKLPNFRVIAVFPTRERMENVRAKMTGPLVNQKFWLTVSGSIRENPTGEIFTTAKDDELLSLAL